jgi:hypothetical protein
MEILQVKGVVPHLLDGRSLEGLCPDLEFENKDDWTGQDDCIDAPSHARDAELQEDCSA